MSEILHESSTTLQDTSAAKWKAVLITPGQGSSGFYSEAVLQRDGGRAFPSGTHSYIDHPRDGESRSAKNLFGVLTEDAHFEPGIGLVATLAVLPHWQAFSEAVAPHVGLSIYASAERTRGADGTYVVESILPDRSNTVDVVGFPGRPGSGLKHPVDEAAVEHLDKLYESAINSPLPIATNGQSGITPDILAAISEQVQQRFEQALAEETSTKTVENGQLATNPNTGKEKIANMEIDTLAERVDALQESVKTLLDVVGPLAENLAAAKQEPKQIEEAVEIDFSKIAEACFAASLPEAARTVVYNEVRNGVDPDVAIANQRSLVESIEASVTESLGAARVRVGTDSPNQDFTLHNAKWAVTR